jgi:hypothetical protein
MKAHEFAICLREDAFFTGGSAVSARVPEGPRHPCRRIPDEVETESLEHHREPNGFHPSNAQVLYLRQPVESRHRRLDTVSVPVAVLERLCLLCGASSGESQIALRGTEPVSIPHRLDRAETVGVIGRAIQAGVEGGGDRLDRQVGQNLLAEESGQGSVEELPQLGSQVRPRVEKRASASAPDVERGFSCKAIILHENCPATRSRGQVRCDRNTKKISRLSKNDFLQGRQR